VRVVAAALVGLALTGCAPAVRQPYAPAPTAFNRRSALEAGEAMAPARTVQAQLVSTIPDATTSAPEEPTSPTESAGTGAFEPGVVHRARVAMARAALVEDNLNKARVDLAEELARELAAIQDSETSKSRVKHGKPTKKQP
jgi:hypothetical protein